MADFGLGSSYVIDLARELSSIVSGIVVKREDLAYKYETAETARDYEYYIAALNERDTFESYDKYELEILEQAGLTFEEIQKALLSKKNIPEDKRETVLLLQRQHVINSYVEKNNYYRMLNGLPAMEDYLEIYIHEDIDGVDTSKPIHEMDNDEIFILNNIGYIDRLIEEYPARTYLKFLGSNRIDIVTARTAKRFDIFRTGPTTNLNVKRRFMMNYELSRTYILNNYYKRRFSLDQTYYDAYIGFLIAINAMIMTVNDSVDMFNKHEFTNELTTKLLLQSNNLDIFDDIPFVYRKRIADNIKSLIVSKGTDEVIFKIFNLFGFQDISVRKFMLVKEHLKNVDGEYIFEYEEDGVTPKYDKMYDIYFSQIDIRASNIDNEIRRPENKLAYFEVTANDIYWGAYETPEEIRRKLLKEDFNYIDTDYININTAYAISRLMFEVSYFFSTVLALKSSLENLTLIEPLFGQTIDLFYALTIVTALLCKKIGFNGEIPKDPVDIAEIYKFNFDRSISHINEIMKKYGYKSNFNFAPNLPYGKYSHPSELVDLFFRNKEIYDQLVSIKTNTRDLNEYLACDEILQYIAHSKLSSSIYTKPDNTLADTYFDYLKSRNHVIGTFIEEIDPEIIDDTIFRILSSLESFIESDRLEFVFINTPTFSGENALKIYMQKVINTFKAFTINIFSMSITYDIDSLTNNIKILDSHSVQGHLYTHDGIPVFDSMGIRGHREVETGMGFRDELIILNKNKEEV